MSSKDYVAYAMLFIVVMLLVNGHYSVANAITQNFPKMVDALFSIELELEAWSNNEMLSNYETLEKVFHFIMKLIGDILS